MYYLSVCGSGVGTVCRGSLFKVFQGCSLCAGWAVFSSGGLTREEFASKLSQMVWRINLLVAGGLRSLVYFAGLWQRTTLHSWRLLIVPCHVAFSIDPLKTWQLTFSKPARGKCFALVC